MFGISPIDSALSALGLNLSQVLMDFIFQKSKIGYLCFCIGFCYHIYQCTKRVNYRPLLVHFAIFIACLIIVQTPPRNEGNITSAWERYCPSSTTQGVCLPPAITTRNLKFSQTDKNVMPALLSYLGEGIDSLTIGSIYALSGVFTKGHVQYLMHPFGIQDTALRLHQEVQEGITDLTLKRKAGDFIYAYYLPALIMVRDKNEENSENKEGNENERGVSKLSLYGPYHEKIIEQYSSGINGRWNTLKKHIKDERLTDAQSAWGYAKNIFDAHYPQWSQSSSEDDILIDALLRREIKAVDAQFIQGNEWHFKTANALLQAYPYAQGYANLILYVFFPVILCFVLTFARLDLLFFWFKSLIWVKSWVLTAALSYWVSLLLATVQAKTAIGSLEIGGRIKWFWQEPYFSLAASILIYVTPVMMFFLIFQGIKLKPYQYIRACPSLGHERY